MTASVAGRVYVFSGADFETPALVLDGREAGEFFGFGIGGLGDIDGNGLGDFAIGAPMLNSPDARAYVLGGGDGLPILDTLLPDATGSRFGQFFISGPGDVDFDGHADLLVAAFRSSSGASNGGRAFVFSGSDGSVLRTMTGTDSRAREGLLAAIA